MGNLNVELVPLTWDEAVAKLGIAGTVAMLEDQAQSLCAAMFGKSIALEKHVIQGLPVLLPVAAEGVMFEVSAPGEGESMSLCSLLAGFALTAHAAEYLYYGSDSRFAIAQKVRAYKYLVQAAALACAGRLVPAQANSYEELLGLSW
ncbi:hypothetical protein [Stutzerimonas stutzeri]|uniref:hypothetical protein n=1 Tax=Stutzerimonas stutzeri TaxID=316 RepID=UPI00265CBC4C|nr:hypothetical protein [Stutzerimonas stutzeri]MCF6783702.1 hypothetical protein [Stutzerimonas stutzeri]